ncbi:MAG TPA: 30S ribosomal protein S16 [candidate division Zixibacteria bacterium]|nr:30S ribosomal protein S16 [candidate division Zixibacteria bacterium]
MLRIRLSRTGAKGQPSYRIVVTDAKFKRDGRIVERIGHYNPRTDPLEYLVTEDRALYWLSVGAQPSEAVERLLVKQGTIDRLARLRKGEAFDALVAEYSGDTEVADREEATVEAAIVSEIEELAELEEEE